MKTPKGFILDRFESPIDGNPCVAILTTSSSNRKTGNMMQVWILREDIHPTAAIETGDDYSICGNCPHRKNLITKKRSCYVNVGQAPSAVWRTYRAGKYQEDVKWNDRDLFAGRMIRWGAYGDPGILNSTIVDIINFHSAGWTGYTHQWREPFAQDFKGTFMASCDGMRDYLEASAHGWKCFSVAPVGQTGQGKQCPATVDNSQAQCATCRLCDGMKQDIWVEAHGPSRRHVGAIIEESPRELSQNV